MPILQVEAIETEREKTDILGATAEQSENGTVTAAHPVETPVAMMMIVFIDASETPMMIDDVVAGTGATTALPDKKLLAAVLHHHLRKENLPLI